MFLYCGVFYIGVFYVGNLYELPKYKRLWVCDGVEFIGRDRKRMHTRIVWKA